MEEIKNFCAQRREDGIIWNQMDDIIMVIASRNGKDRVFNLNETAALIWQQCDGSKTVADIAEHVGTVYKTEQAAALTDTIECINDLKTKDLITLTNPENNAT